MLSPSCTLTPQHCAESSSLDFPRALRIGPAVVLVTVYRSHLTNRQCSTISDLRNGSLTWLDLNARLSTRPDGESSEAPEDRPAQGHLLRECTAALEILDPPVGPSLLHHHKQPRRKAPGWPLPLHPHPSYPLKITRRLRTAKTSFLHNLKTSLLKSVFQRNRSAPLGAGGRGGSFENVKKC